MDQHDRIKRMNTPSNPHLLPPTQHEPSFLRQSMKLLFPTAACLLVGWHFAPSVWNSFTGEASETTPTGHQVQFIADELQFKQRTTSSGQRHEASTQRVQSVQFEKRVASSERNPTPADGPRVGSSLSPDHPKSTASVTAKAEYDRLQSWKHAVRRWSEDDSWSAYEAPPFKIDDHKPILSYTDAPWADLVDVEADALLLDTNADMSISVLDINRGHQYGYKETVPRYLASGIKLYYMLEVFRQRDAGLLHLDEQLLYTNQDVRDGAPTMNRSARNRYYTFHELVAYMIRDSDNTAADMVAKRIGLDNVALTLDQLKLTSYGPVVNIMDLRREVHRTLDPRADRMNAIQVRDVRWRNGFKPRLDILKKHIGEPLGTYTQKDLEAAYVDYYKKKRNHLNMRDVSDSLARLVKGELFAEDTTHEILYLLENTWNSNTRIVGALPQGTRVAHKTGTQHKRICDLAVLSMPDGSPLVLTIAVEGVDRVPAEKILFQITQTIYDVVKEFSEEGVEEEYRMFSSDDSDSAPVRIKQPG